MKKELENKIAEKYPFMARKEGIANPSTFDKYGYEAHDGWFNLICDLCEEISAAYKKAGKPVDLVPVQVKEKFATLRFYYDIGGTVQGIHAFDFMETGSGIRFTNEDNEFNKEISDIVRKYEKKSATVCEYCGKEGRLRDELPWLLTLCDECNDKRMKEYKERCKKYEEQSHKRGTVKESD